MHFNAIVALAVLGLGVVVCQNFESKPTAGAVIYIDASGTAPSNVKKWDCSKHNFPRKHGGRVCGTDGKTYANSLYLKCISRQNPAKQLEIRNTGACRKKIPQPIAECERNMLYAPICGSDNRTYANFDALKCKNAITPGSNVTVLRQGECNPEKCPCKGETDKVCGSNGITYRSVCEVRCMKKYHPELRVTHAGGCTVREVRKAFGRRMSCHLARNRFEWNPYCGLNDQTYANPYLYICHHPRNESKCAARPGECGSLVNLACINAEKISKNLMSSGVIVCGSNAVNYRSYEHLHCSTLYDKYLQAMNAGRCSRRYDPCALLEGQNLTDQGSPVCGTDNVTYVDIKSLWCVKYLKKKDLRYRHDGACL